jgi:hypothetical protein
MTTPCQALLSGGPETPLGQESRADKQAWEVEQASPGPGSPESLAGLPGPGGGAARPLSGFSKAEDTDGCLPPQAGQGGRGR